MERPRRDGDSIDAGMEFRRVSSGGSDDGRTTADDVNTGVPVSNGTFDWPGKYSSDAAVGAEITEDTDVDGVVVPARGSKGNVTGKHHRDNHWFPTSQYE